MVKTKYLIAGIAALAIVAVLLAMQGGFLANIGSSYTQSATGVRVSQWFPGGGVSVRVEYPRVYGECVADLPNYQYRVPGMFYTPAGEERASLAGASGQLFSYDRPVYSATQFSGGGASWNVLTYNKPRQHPDCVQLIRDFVASSGVNVTEVVMVNNTVVDTVYVTQTIYACADGQYSLERDACVSPIVVADVKPWYLSVWDWLRGLFN